MKAVSVDSIANPRCDAACVAVIQMACDCRLRNLQDLVLFSHYNYRAAHAVTNILFAPDRYGARKEQHACLRRGGLVV
jgi:hypothetical protein